MFDDVLLNTIMYKYIFAAVFAIARALLLSIAVRYYNEYRGIKEKNSLYAFIFLFGLVAVIIYLIKSKNDMQNMENTCNSAKGKTMFIILIIVYIALLVVYEIALYNFNDILTFFNVLKISMLEI